MSKPKAYESAQSFVFIVGIYEGIVPLVCKPFGWHPLLAFPLRLSHPWWWIVSVLVIVVGIALLETLDQAKKRAGAPSPPRVH